MVKNIFGKIGAYISAIINNIWYFSHKQKYRHIRDFKDKYAGESCFIVGNGPSLLPEDLDRIDNLGIVTFAANKIYNIFDKTQWRPTYYCISDDGYSKSDEVFKNVEQFQPKMFFGKSQFAYYQRNIKCCHMPIFSHCSRKYLENPRFSMDLEKGIYDIATVTYFSIQLAVYMGFKEIYLIGMDNKYAYSRLKDGNIVRNEGVLSYFKENGEDTTQPKVVAPTWEMDVAYEYAEEFSMSNDFRIYNATRGGFLEKFERVNLDDILENIQYT
jgi:hypothetical protein